MNAAPAWRTVITALAVAFLQFVAFIFFVHHGASAEGSVAFGSFCLWSTTAAVGQAAKSLGEQLGKGSGWRGALNVLKSDAKPGDPAPAPEPEPAS